MIGVSIHLACTTYDPPTPNTISCAGDAEALRVYARQQGFLPLLNPDVTRIDAATDTAIQDFLTAAENLVPGDYLAITYCGHGIAAARQATDSDRGWALFGGNILTFTELFTSLARHLQTGVRVLIVSDSCQSGSEDLPADGGTPLEVPHDVAMKLFSLRAAQLLRFEMFDDLAVGNPTIMKIAACGPDQLARDGSSVGQPSRFCARLLDVLNKRPAKQSFTDFTAMLQAGAPAAEVPDVDRIGPFDQAFEDVGPFRLI